MARGVARLPVREPFAHLGRKLCQGKTARLGRECQQRLADRLHPGFLQIHTGQTSLTALGGRLSFVKTYLRDCL